MKMIKLWGLLAQMIFYNVKNHLLGTGPARTGSQVCGGLEMSLSRHQEGPWEDKGSVSRVEVCPHERIRPLCGVGIGCRLSLGDVLSYCCPTELMGFILS